MMSGVSPNQTGAAEGPNRLIGLLDRIAQRDELALAELYDATNRVVYGMALRLVRDPSSAEDITLEVFLQVWRTAGNYTASKSSVISWLAMLARSRSIDWLRTPQARLGQQSRSLDEVYGFPDEEAGPEDACIEAARNRAVRDGIGKLPPEQRQVIELAYFSGLSHTEIAGRLGQPLGTVKTRIRAGMSQLRSLVLRSTEVGA